MTKLFLFLIIALFLAEVILAIVAIINICKLNNAVNKLNNKILIKQQLLRPFFHDLRAIFQSFVIGIESLKKYITEKKTEYLYNIIKTAAVYLSIFSLKGKYKKAVIGIQLAKEIYEGINET